MQATITQPNARARRGRGQRPSFKGIGRAIKYLTHYGRQAVLPYIFLIIATLSQLAVPHMIRNVIDAVTSGYLADQVLEALDKIPAQFVGTALPKILEALGYDSAITMDQLKVTLEADINNAPRALVTALVAIVIFAVLRGLFSFLQAFWAEKNSQSVAYDLRNDLYAKIQELSFSYHDKNQTGQLMIRATDDVEKVRLFIGQGLLQLVGAVILLTGTVIILFSSNVSLAWTAMPILPIAMVLFAVFASLSPAVVHEGAAKTFDIEYGLAGKSGRCQSHQGIHTREDNSRKNSAPPQMTR